MKIRFKNTTNNSIVKTETGFSWTTLFFGGFVALFRGDVKYFFAMLLIAIPTLGFSWLVFPFIYNGIYIKKLLQKHYVPADNKTEMYLKAKGWIT